MSVIKRSAISLAANVTKAIISFATGILIARGLGPEEYGVFSFLLASLTALRYLLDMGTSNAFFSFISKKNRSRSFFYYYFSWVFTQFIISILFIAFIAPDDWVQRIWEGESRERVIIAFVAVFLQHQVWNMVGQIGESQRFTVRVQVINIAISIMHLIMVICLFWLDVITVEFIYYIIIIEILVATVVAKLTLPIEYTHEQVEPKTLFNEYWVYCLPLIPFGFLAMIMGFFDVWLLQHYGGAVEQAYYSVAKQFSSISLIATSSILRILWKEIAEANEQGNSDRMQSLYEKTNHILFMFGVVISCFLIPWTNEIILFTLGDSYSSGAFVMGLMFLYPIHQSLGQVNATMFLALELTRPYVVISMFSGIFSLLVVYFLLAPNDAAVPGLGLASIGLAFKMVVIQFVSVNFAIWWLSQHQGWKFSMVYQFISLGLFLLIGFGAYHAAYLLTGGEMPFLFTATLSGVMYMLLTGTAFYSMPWLLGMGHDEMKDYVRKFINKTINIVK